MRFTQNWARAQDPPSWMRYWPVARWGMFGGALAYCLLVLSGAVSYGTPHGELVMGDAAAYYFANDPPYDWSDRPPGAGEYRYSPAFLWLIALVRIFPWEAFAAIWFAAHIGVLLYLRLPWMLAFPGVIDDAVRGNINTFLALAAVLIVRHGATWLWATVFLTKITPGVAVVWHAARGEWRQLAVAGMVTAAIVGIGSVVNPAPWSQWWESLTASPATYPTVGALAPLALRLPAGALVAAYAAISNRAWLLPVAMLIAVPGVWPSSFALLLASVALRGSAGWGVQGKARPPRAAAPGSNTARPN